MAWLTWIALGGAALLGCNSKDAVIGAGGASSGGASSGGGHGAGGAGGNGGSGGGLTGVWARGYGAPDNKSTPRGLAVDPTGNLVLAGDLIDTVNFGGDDLVGGGDALNAEIFVVRLNPLGGHLWSKELGGAADNRVFALALSGANPVLAGAYHDGAVDLGCGALTIVDEFNDLFVAGLDTDGGCLWDLSAGAPSAESEAYDVAVDPSGGVLVAGTFQDAIDFGQGTLSSAGSNDVFVAKLDQGGGPPWNKRYGDLEYQRGLRVAAASQDSVLVAGEFTSEVDFSDAGNEPLFAEANPDLFLAALGSGGGHLWSRKFMKSGAGSLFVLAGDPGGDTVIAGTFYGRIDLGEGPVQAAATDVFVARLNPEGGLRWGRTIPPTGTLIPTDAVVDAAGDVILALSLTGTANFGGMTIASTGTCMGAAQCNDIVLVKIARDDGAYLGIRQLGGEGDEIPHALALTPGGGLVMTGVSDGVLDFGGGVSANGGLFVVMFDPWVSP
jgi:hypothetical protein